MRNAFTRAAAYQPGKVVLGKYELIRPLARGGMGVVWVATHRALRVEVAVKLSTATGTDVSKASRHRALSEARLAARLQHPAICRVLDVGETAQGDACVVTELLRGETLDRALTVDGRIRPIEAVQTLLPILDALAVAHEHGIVHQDVKPSNVFLARDAQNRIQPKLLDFGIARAQNERASWAPAGTISGTPCYMSPEQASARDDVDHRSDLWSVSATLYELLTGTPPFDGESCASMLARVIQSQPRPLSAHLVTDDALCAIVMRGLAKNRDERWQSAAELATELACWLLDQGVESDVSGHALRARVPAPPWTPALQSDVTQPLPPVSGASFWRSSSKALLLRATPRAATLAFAVLVIVTASAAFLNTRSASRAPIAASSSMAVSAAVLARSSPRSTRSVDAESGAGVASAATLSSDVVRVEVRAAPASERPTPEIETSESRVGIGPLERPARSVTRAAKTSMPVAQRRLVRPRSRSNDLNYDFGF